MPLIGSEGTSVAGRQSPNGPSREATTNLPNARFEKPQDTISTTPIARETKPLTPQPTEPPATNITATREIGPDPPIEESSETDILAPVHAAISHLLSKSPMVESKINEAPAADAPSTEDTSKKPRASEDAIEEVKATEKARPQSPARLKLFPKRLPVRHIVRSMEGSGLESPTTTKGSAIGPSLESRSMTPPPQSTNLSLPASPAASPGPERQVAAEAANIPHPSTTPSEKSQPLMERHDVPIQSQAKDSTTEASGGHANQQTAQTMMSRAREALAAAKGAMSKKDATEEDLPSASKSVVDESPSADHSSSKSQANVQISSQGLSQVPTKADQPAITTDAVEEAAKPVVSPAPAAAASRKAAATMVEEAPIPLESPESSEASDTPPQEATLDSKLPILQTITVQEVPRPYLSEPSEPPQSPLPQIPLEKPSEHSKTQSSPAQDADPSLSRRPSTEFSISRNSQSRPGRSSTLLRSNTPDIITRRTSKDRLARSPTPITGSSSSYPSRQLSLKLPVNPNNGFSQSGRISPSGRSPTPDTLTRRVSQEQLQRSSTIPHGERESVSSRISFNVPVNRHNSFGQSGRTSPFIRSATPDSIGRRTSRERLSASPAPTEPLDFLAALAAQERLVLELKEEAQQAEEDLEILKHEWASQDPHKKQEALRQVEEMLRIGGGGAQPSRNSSLRDIDGKAEETEDASKDRPEPQPEQSPPAEVKVKQRTVFQGSREMRPLSLLSPIETNSRASSPNPKSRNRFEDTEVHAGEKERRMPSPMSEPDSEPESEPDMEAEMEPGFKERSDALSIIQEEASMKSIKHDSLPLVPPLPADEDFMKNSLQLAINYREGLETFLEDLKKANSGPEKLPSTTERETDRSISVSDLPKKKSSKSAAREKEQQPKTPPPELKKSNSLIKATLVEGDGNRHHSSIVDLDSEFFDNDLWKEPSTKSPVLVSPKRDENESPKQPPKPLRRYLNIQSEENLAVYPSEDNQEHQGPSHRKESPTSSRETASTRRRSASTERSNPRSSTTSTHEDGNPKRASSPLLVEQLPSPSPRSPKLEASKSSAAIRPTVMNLNLESGPSTTLKPKIPSPSRALIAKADLEPEKSPGPQKSPEPQKHLEPQKSPEPKREEVIPRLLPPRGMQELPPTSRFSTEMAPILKRTASNLMLKLEKSMTNLRSIGTKEESEKEEVMEILSNPVSSPRHIALSSSPPKEDPLGMSPPSPFPPSFSRDSRTSNVRTSHATSGRADKELPPLPPPLEDPSREKLGGMGASAPRAPSVDIKTLGARSAKKEKGKIRKVLNCLPMGKMAPAKLGPRLRKKFSRQNLAD